MIRIFVSTVTAMPTGTKHGTEYKSFDIEAADLQKYLSDRRVGNYSVATVVGAEIIE